MQILLILLLSLLFAIHIESIPYHFQGEYQNGIHTDEKDHNSNGVADYGEWDTDYPEVHISNLLETFPGIAEIFSTSTDFDNFVYDENETNDMDLCKSWKGSIMPRKYRNINNVSKFIVNQVGAVQNIQVTVCMGSTCSDAEEFNDEVSSSCKQNYLRMQLLTLKNDNKTLEWDFFDFLADVYVYLCISMKNVGTNFNEINSKHNNNKKFKLEVGVLPLSYISMAKMLKF
ncbi:hypothetical protein WA026_005521 [Henosepilachna vigintioctopunctata]|uniref:Spaetzle domain-containing protein n=1 Tax=Henosepilachna vigintioctopunctata TaxID=420089 RepID=A0AAW1U2C5_9CUCU